MSIRELIDNLRTAEGPSRRLDVDIAMEMGYRRKEAKITVDHEGKMVKRNLWVVPSGQDTDRVPFYTKSLDHAFQLAHEIDPDHDGGCSWVNGRGTAKIGDGPYCQGATPPLALCIAALLRKLKLEGHSN